MNQEILSTDTLHVLYVFMCVCLPEIPQLMHGVQRRDKPLQRLHVVGAGHVLHQELHLGLQQPIRMQDELHQPISSLSQDEEITGSG